MIAISACEGLLTAPKPESTETNSQLGRGCERSARWLLRAFGHASTDALPHVLVTAFGSSRPASQSASSVRWIRAQPGASGQGRDVPRPLRLGATGRSADTAIYWLRKKA